jgi:hypothetical protein
MRRFGSIVSWTIGALSLTTPGRKILDKLFWNWIFELAGPIEPFFVDAAFPIVFFAVGLFLWTRDGYGALLLERTKAMLNVYYVVATVAAVVLVGALILAWLDHRRGPVDWVESTGSPISFWMRAGGPLLVANFSVIGRNKTDEPVGFGDCFIRSDITNAIVRFRIGVVGGDISPSEATLEPKGSVIMVGDYPATDVERRTGEISVQRFREEFGRFTFHVEYRDGRKFERSFTASDVDHLIDGAARHHAKQLQREPGVIRNRN